MPGHINLQLGWPSPSLFPAQRLQDAASRILESQKKTAIASVCGPDAGYAPLREHLAAWLSSVYTCSDAIPIERICISNGASGNLDSILAKFTEVGYTRYVWMVEPSYFLACPIFTDAGFDGRLRGIPEDEEGIDINFLQSALEAAEREDHPKAPHLKTSARYAKLYKHIIYAVPTFANPSAKTMSLRRRRELVRLAREYDALIVTDDVYDVLRWPQQGGENSSLLPLIPPRIVDVDRGLDGGPKDQWGNAVSNGSFSKIIGPGVRTGWCEATPALVQALSSLGSTESGGCPSHLAATFIAEMLSSGGLQSHINDVLIPTFRARSRALLAAVDRSLVPLGCEISVGKPYDPDGMEGKGTDGTNGDHAHVDIVGGYFTYLALPPDLGVGAEELAGIALADYDLKFAYGGMMTVEGDRGSVERAAKGYGKGIRLRWAWHTAEEIEEGIVRLSKVIGSARSGRK